MPIFGRSVETNDLIVGGIIVGGLGICYVSFAYLRAIKCNKFQTGVSRGHEDLELPLLLEYEYGNFKETCLAADPNIAGFLKDLPEQWFQFNHSFLQLINVYLKKNDSVSTRNRALVIGSGTGRLTFDLAKLFSEVKGIDNSFTKIVTCQRFQNYTPVIYYFPLEGCYRTSQKTLTLRDLISQPSGSRWRGNTSSENTEFICTNPSFVPSQLGQFQGVFLPNSLNNLDDPEGLLRKVHQFVESEGYLYIYSDYNWRRITNKHEGFGEVHVTNSFEFLKIVLSKHFILQEEKNFMSVLPESLRSCRITNIHVTVWYRKPSPEN